MIGILSVEIDQEDPVHRNVETFHDPVRRSQGDGIQFPDLRPVI